MPKALSKALCRRPCTEFIVLGRKIMLSLVCTPRLYLPNSHTHIAPFDSNLLMSYTICHNVQQHRICPNRGWEGKYRSHPTSRVLLAFVYDPEKRITNFKETEKDSEQSSYMMIAKFIAKIRTTRQYKKYKRK